MFRQAPLRQEAPLPRFEATCLFGVGALVNPARCSGVDIVIVSRTLSCGQYGGGSSVMRTQQYFWPGGHTVRSAELTPGRRCGTKGRDRHCNARMAQVYRQWRLACACKQREVPYLIDAD